MTRHLVVLIGLCVFFLFAASIALAGENSIVAYEGSTLWGYAYDVGVSGDYAFYPKKYGLEVANISDPLNPTIAARFRINGGCHSIFISGNLAYMTLEDDGFSIVDISDPLSPFLINTFYIEGSQRNITVNGNIAFISQREVGVHLVNIADPYAPYLLSTFETESDPRRVAVSGNLAYITQINYGLQIIDFSNATSPELIGVFEGVGSYNGTDYRDIILYGSYAFIADYAYNVTHDSGGFQVLNISDPTDPELVYLYDLHLVLNLTLDGTTLYISTQTTGVHSFDVSSPASPLYLDNNIEYSYLSEMAIYNDYLVTTGRNCEIYDISDPSAISLASYNRVMSSVYSVITSGNYAYIGHSYSGMTIVDISDPSSPEPVANHATAGGAHVIKVIDDLAYVTSTAGMEIFDVSDPLDPTLLGYFQDSDSCGCEEFTIVGDLAYITGSPHEMYIVDISDPYNPLHICTYSPPPSTNTRHLENIAITGTTAYLCDWGSDIVYIVDVSDPSAPVEVGRYEGLPNPAKTNFIGDYAYLCSYSSGTDILDVTDPVNPVKVGHFDGGSQHEPGLIGDFIFFEDAAILEEMLGYDIFIYNIADLANPEFIGKFKTPGMSQGIMPSGDFLYVADNDALLVMSLNLPIYKSGDANGDGTVDVGDAVHLINHIFRAGPAPEPLEAGDANCDGEVNVGDAVNLINYVFSGGDAPCYGK